MSKGVADLVSSLEEDTLTKSKAKLRLRLSTAATFTEDLATDGETLGHHLDRESFINDFCVSEITFLNEIVLYNRRSQGRHSADQIRKTINMRQFLAMNHLRVIQNSLICFVKEILTISLILYTIT
jgi:hypothetical protein